jgi:hypothetical protein
MHKQVWLLVEASNQKQLFTMAFTNRDTAELVRMAHESDGHTMLVLPYEYDEEQAERDGIELEETICIQAVV